MSDNYGNDLGRLGVIWVMFFSSLEEFKLYFLSASGSCATICCWNRNWPKWWNDQEDPEWHWGSNSVQTRCAIEALTLLVLRVCESLVCHWTAECLVGLCFMFSHLLHVSLLVRWWHYTREDSTDYGAPWPGAACGRDHIRPAEECAGWRSPRTRW